jgi:hypothetical protein
MWADGRKKHNALLEVILGWINIDSTNTLEEEVNHHRAFGVSATSICPTARAIKIHVAHTAYQQGTISIDAYTV